MTEQPTTPIEALRLLERTANTLIVRYGYADKAESDRHIQELWIAADLAREVLDGPTPDYNPPWDELDDDVGDDVGDTA